VNAKKARALISIGADSAKLGSDLADAKKRLRGFTRDVKKIIGKGFGGGKKLLGGAAGLVGTGFGIQAAGGISDMLGDLLTFEKGLTRFQIASGKTAAETAAFRDQVLGVSKSTGVASAEILAGAQSYVDLTGDVAGASSAMSAFARVAQASGSTVSDIATAAAAMQQSLGIDSKDIESTFSGMIAQGKMGAVSLKDFAGELAAIAPRWAKFNEATTTTGVAQMGAAFQVARQGFGSASEAATGLAALMGAITQNAKKFEKGGVKVFDKNPKTGVKTLRTFDQIMRSIGTSKLVKDPTLLAKAFGSKEAAQTFDMLTRNRGLFDDLVKAGADANAVSRDLGTYQESAAGKIEAAWNNAKIALAEAFTPERIERFAKVLAKAADLMGKIVGYVADVVDFVDNASGVTDKEFGGVEYSIRKNHVDSMGLDERGRKAELGKRALALAANPSNTASGNAEAGMAAARKLAADAGILIPQDDAWAGHKTPIQQIASNAGFSPQRFLDGMKEALRTSPIVVKIDSAIANEKVSNSPTHRKGR
jgi:TP901 family phage tail tape measure protein